MKTYGMTEKKYKRIFEPDEVTNNCCYLCKKSAGGCNWSRDFSPVPGWEVIETKPRKYDKGEPGNKILYCPEFVEGDLLEGILPDSGGVVRLYEAVLRSTATDYIEALTEKKRCEKLLCDPSLSDKYKERVQLEINRANSTIITCEKLLGKHAITLRNRFYDDTDEA